MPEKIDVGKEYKNIYTKITGDTDSTLLDLCMMKQIQSVPINIYGDPASVPEDFTKLPDDIIEVCMGRAVYAACVIYKNMKKSGNDDEDADTDQFLSSFSAGGVSMSFSSAESSAGKDTDTEDFEALKQILWEIPRELYRKYRTNKNCYWRV